MLSIYSPRCIASITNSIKLVGSERGSKLGNGKRTLQQRASCD